MSDHEAKVLLRAQLQTLLDQVDYTAGACRLTEMVGACLDAKIIERCKELLLRTK